MDVDLAKQCLEDKKALTLDANQIKKTISGSKVQKRKNVVQVLDSPFVYDWYLVHIVFLLSNESFHLDFVVLQVSSVSRAGAGAIVIIVEVTMRTFLVICNINKILSL